MLLACPRKAGEVAVVARLEKFRPHDAMAALARETEPQTAYAVLEGLVREFAAKPRSRRLFQARQTFRGLGLPSPKVIEADGVIVSDGAVVDGT
jgi:hypothetical protein